jgi:hypothetical protein
MIILCLDQNGYAEGPAFCSLFLTVSDAGRKAMGHIGNDTTIRPFSAGWNRIVGMSEETPTWSDQPWPYGKGEVAGDFTCVDVVGLLSAFRHGEAW